MKNLILSLVKYKKLFFIFVLLATLTSCSTYQTTSRDTDGIYDIDNTSSKKEVAQQETEPQQETNTKALKYQEYFKKKADKIIIEEDDIFTDADSYTSEEDLDEEILEQDVSDFSSNFENPSWEESGETVVNVYNYGTLRPYYGWNRYYYGWRPFRPFYSGLYIGISPWYSSWDYCLTGYDYYNPYYSSYYYPSYYSPYNTYYPSYAYSGYHNPRYYGNYYYGRRNNTVARNSSRNRATVRRSQSTTNRNTTYRNQRTVRTNRKPTTYRTRTQRTTRSTNRKKTYTSSQRKTTYKKPSSTTSRSSSSSNRSYRSSSSSRSHSSSRSSSTSSSRSSSSRKR